MYKNATCAAMLDVPANTFEPVHRFECLGSLVTNGVWRALPSLVDLYDWGGDQAIGLSVPGFGLTVSCRVATCAAH